MSKPQRKPRPDAVSEPLSEIAPAKFEPPSVFRPATPPPKLQKSSAFASTIRSWTSTFAIWAAALGVLGAVVYWAGWKATLVALTLIVAALVAWGNRIISDTIEL